jgi:hypothetical protein
MSGNSYPGAPNLDTDPLNRYNSMHGLKATLEISVFQWICIFFSMKIGSFYMVGSGALFGVKIMQTRYSIQNSMTRRLESRWVESANRRSLPIQTTKNEIESLRLCVQQMPAHPLSYGRHMSRL